MGLEKLILRITFYKQEYILLNNFPLKPINQQALKIDDPKDLDLSLF